MNDTQTPQAPTNQIVTSATEGQELPPLNPVIRIRAGEVDQNVDEAIDALARNAAQIYQRDGRLVRIVDVATDKGVEPRIEDVSLYTLRECLTRSASWVKPDGRKGGHDVSATPNDYIVGALAKRGEYPGIRVLNGIVETPIIRPDGTILEQPGYDDQTACVYRPSIAFPGVPAHPSHQDAATALGLLNEAFRDFPYRAPADRMVPIAALLTLLGRTAIPGPVPLMIFDASVAGAGKGLQVAVCSIVATGREPALLSFPTRQQFGSGAKSANLEELGKLLDAAALQSARMVVFDNVDAPFGGAPLDKLITSERVELRVLGKTEMPNVRWLGVVFATGNNVEVVGDTRRRCMVSRIIPSCENPELRKDFKHPELVAYVRSERAELVIAGLTILRAYIAAGRPRLVATGWGSFEAWSALIPQALVFAGGTDPLTCRLNVDATRVRDPHADALNILFQNWTSLAPSGEGTARDIIDALFPGRKDDGLDEVRDAVRLLTNTRPPEDPTPVKFAASLGKARERVIDGRSVIDIGKNRKGSTIYRLVEGAGDAAVADVA